MNSTESIRRSPGDTAADIVKRSKLSIWWCQRWIRLLRKKEPDSRRRIPVRLMTRIRLWFSGFFGESHVIYKLEERQPSDYLSDFARFIKTPYINGRYSYFLNNKLAFYWFMRGNEEGRKVIPKIHALIYRGDIRDLNSGQRIEWKEALRKYSDEKKRFVIKPINEGGGKGVMVVSTADDVLRVNELPVENMDAAMVSKGLAGRDGIIMEYVSQASYAATIFPCATNTIRVLTMWDYDENEPFMPIAVHRIGSKDSMPVDNWSNGGLSAIVNTETGELGRAVAYPGTGSLVWFDEHPDTGAMIKGVHIPNWEKIADKLLELARMCPFLPYVGWDIIVTEDGMKILEGNNHSDVNLIQVHQPMLVDSRVRRFYERFNAGNGFICPSLIADNKY